MWKAIPEVIRAAATSKLGVWALVVVVLGLVAVIFFRDESGLLKLGIFILMFVGFGLFLMSASRVERKSSSSRTKVQSDNRKLPETQSFLAAAREYYHLDRNDKARTAYTEAGTLFRAVGDRQGEAHVLHGQGDLERKLGRNDQARTAYRDALTLYGAVGDRQGEANVLLGQGELER